MAVASAKTATKKVHLTFAFMKSSIRNLIEVGNDQEAASDQFTADPKSLSDCGHACHAAVKAKHYIFHPYQKR
jgi:hypothetical protein